MSQDNYNFRYEAYKNNTFNFNALEKSLDESKMSGYQYLRQFQLDSTGYKRFDFKMQDIYKTCNINHDIKLLPRRWVFFVDYEFINVGKRLAYKRSNLYEKEVSFDDNISRPELFDSTFIVFIDGKLYTKGINILCKEDKTYMIFYCKEAPSSQGFTLNDMKKFIDNNVDVSIYFIPNIGIRNIGTNAYRIRTLNKESGIPLRTLGLTDYIDYNNSLAYINPINSIESIPTSINLTDEGLYVNNDDINIVIQNNPDNTALNLQLIPLRNFLTKIEVKGDKWFEIPMQDYPIAVENCIVVDENNNFVHKAKITHYYPNIYSIENVEDILRKGKLYVYVFYYENKISKLKHLDMLAAYHKYVPDYLERYKNKTIPEIVKNFNPKIVDYSIKNYRRGLGLGDHDTTIYIKDEHGVIYEISFHEDRLYSNIYNGNDKDDVPEYYYVYDDINNNTYKLGISEDGELYTEQYIGDIEVIADLLYIFNPFDQSHNELKTCKGVLAVYDYLKYTDHFKYKVIKMREFIKADVNNFRRYLRNLGLGNNYYYVDVSKIDLTQRKRTNNRDTKLDFVSFGATMYMFVFRNDFRGMYDDIIIHVDGIRYTNEIQVFRTSMLDYVYIPHELVKKDSIIEVEKISETKRDIHFSSEHVANIIKLDLGEVAYRNKTLFNDLFITDRATGDYIPTSAYQLILPIVFHMDDIESDIILDYIITETDPGYFQLVALNNGLIEVYKDDELENADNAYFLSLQNNKSSFYQFDMENNVAKFNKVEYVNNYVINKIRALHDKKLIYQFKMVNGSIKMEISEDDGTGKTLAEGGLNLLDIGDVFIPCPREIKLRIVDKDYLHKDLALHVRKDHNINLLEEGILKSDNISDNFKPIKIHTDCKKDSRYFRIYQNGRLMPRHISLVRFPDLNINSDINVMPGFIREQNVDYELTVETLPYMMKQVCYLKTIPRDRVINLKGLIDKPFDFKWYDIYINGRKLVKKDVEIISANLIKILKTNSLQNLEIIENSRDREYFGGFDEGVYDIIDDIFENDRVFADNVNNSVRDNENLRDIEPSITGKYVNPLEYILNAYYNYLVETLGLINPDTLQISRGEIQRFDPLIDEKEPFMLGLDKYGENRLDEERFVLPINPDDN